MNKESSGHWLVLVSTLLLMGIGLLVVSFASQAVALRIGLSDLHFVYRHIAFLCLGICLMFVVSRLDANQIVVLSVLVFIGALALSFFAAMFGSEIKGASRWLSIAGFSIQPSEFLKPALAVILAVLFATHGSKLYMSTLKAAAATGVAVFVLVLQPDIGMTALIIGTFLLIGFLAGWPMPIIGVGIGGLIASAIAAYFTLDHVRSRVDRFLDPESGDTYQVARSFDAISSGGMFGVGLGEGRFRDYVPDVHADFIFSALVEELGMIGGVIVLSGLAGIVLSGIIVAFKARSRFTKLALMVLSVQIGLQSFINLGSTMAVIPTKGMTLPFVSYGGSSLLAACLSVGMILALSRSETLEQRKLLGD